MAPRKTTGLSASSSSGLGSWLSWLRRQGLAGRIGPAAAVGTLVACSASSDPNPPQLGTCTPVNGVACTTSMSGGGRSPLGDGGGGVADSGSAIPAEGGSCPAASEIFNAATMSTTPTTSPTSCVTCVETNCCQSATSCPNDPACLAVATCVVSQCLANDSSCLPTCDAASATGTITEYIQFQQCVGTNCPGCPSLIAAGP